MYKLDDYRIRFEEEGHEYFVNGVKTPCISNILSDVLSNNEPIPDYAKPAMARGTATHKAIEVDLAHGGIDPESIDDEIKGLFKSYSLYKGLFKIEPKLIEKKMYCPSGNYCFTLDFFGMTNGFQDLTDWKTGGMYDKYKAQLGGQLRGLMDFFEISTGINIGCVQLFKDGKIGRKHVYKIEEALKDWGSINHVYQMRNKK